MTGQTERIPKRTRWPSFGQNLILFLIAVIISFLALEGAFRITGIKGDYAPSQHHIVISPFPLPASPLSPLPYGVIRSIYLDNNRGSVDHVLNSEGWRDSERPQKKPQGTYRILGLGDSYLFGQGVRPEHICLTKLREMLQNESPKGMVIETINSGARGFNTVNQRDLLLNRGLLYEPDMVIVHFVLNDVETFDDLEKAGSPKVDFYADYTDIYMAPDTLSQHSYLWGWARQRYLRTVKAKQYVRECLNSYFVNRSKFENCWAALKDINRICKERNVKLLVVIFPFFYNLQEDYPFKPIHDHVKRHCETERIPVLDLLPFYRNYKGPELWVDHTDQHPNETAHEIAAKAIFAYLGEHKQSFDIHSPRP